MERRFQTRLRELLDDAEVSPNVLDDMLPRLETFLDPFVQHLPTSGQQTKARHYVAGLMSDLDTKNVESIAYLHDQDRQGLQKFIGQVEWDHKPLQQELVSQVADQLGDPDGVLVFDPSAFPKKGAKSVGVQRQWCGRLGKVDNCQVGVYLGYVSPHEHALVDFRLYLPEEWANAKPRRTEDAWTQVEVRPGEKGPLVVEAVKCRVQAKTDQRRAGPEETLVVFRERQGNGSTKHDYTLSNKASDTELSQFARVFKAQHRIEECLQRAKGEAGLADYEVRTWDGWHHHQMLSLLAVWFLTQETRRGKKIHPVAERPPSPMGHRDAAPTGVGRSRTEPNPTDHESPFAASRGGAVLLLETT